MGLECVIQDHSSSELNYVSCTPSGVDLSLEPALDLYLMQGFRLLCVSLLQDELLQIQHHCGDMH